MCEYAEVLPLVAPKWLSQALHDLEVVYFGYVNNACTGV
jgi:hypothetical protein